MKNNYVGTFNVTCFNRGKNAKLHEPCFEGDYMLGQYCVILESPYFNDIVTSYRKEGYKLSASCRWGLTMQSDPDKFFTDGVFDRKMPLGKQVDFESLPYKCQKAITDYILEGVLDSRELKIYQRTSNSH
ncbi:MAG: hypothetical protein KGI71_06205 [Patescibacteria group bacterium]|nr:hypothetical protein [Patescibacteria group bacterium]